MEWRLILDPPASGAWNMAVDQALVEAVDAGESPPIVRLFRWAPPCLSLGFSQPPAAADAGFCAAHGIDVVRRPTGGRAVLHHLEITYSVAASLGRPPFGSDLQAWYRAICSALVAGFARLGVPAELSGAPEGGHLRPTAIIPCFVGPASGEVVVEDRKLVGSAMRRLGDAILQHGAILEGWDGALQAGCLGLPDDRELRGGVVTLADVLGSPPAAAPFAEAMREGFREVFGATFRDAGLSEGERARAAFLQRERYGHPRWTIDRDSWLPAPDASGAGRATETR